jgi:DNA invertase Pin-like site-specific DNA recombinase
MNRPIYAYVRTSNLSEKNAIDSDSKKRQLRAIRKFCRSKGYDIKGTFHDICSGDNSKCDIGSRIALNAMLAEMEKTGINAFVIEEQSRLARSVISSCIIREQLEGLGVKCFDSSTGQNLSDREASHEETLIKNILACVAEYEKEKLCYRLQAAKQAKKARGGYIGGIKGLGKDDKHPMEQKMLQRIVELRKSFRHTDGERMTKTKITAILAKEGFVNRKGKPHSVQSITRLINSRLKDGKH